MPPAFPAARCRTMLYDERISEADRDLFYPDKFGKADVGTRSPQDTARMSKDICNGTGDWSDRGPCPHRDECALWALAGKERFGVWGGMSERDRARFRKRMEADREEERERRREAALRGWSERTVLVRLVRAPDWVTVWGGVRDRYALVRGRQYRVQWTRDGWELFRLYGGGIRNESLGMAQELSEARGIIAADAMEDLGGCEGLGKVG